MNWNNDAGPRRVKPVQQAIQNLMNEARTFDEVWPDGTRFSFTQIFGGWRGDVSAQLNEIGERYGWTITVANMRQIQADLEAALVVARQNRPVQEKHSGAVINHGPVQA